MDKMLLTSLQLRYQTILQTINGQNYILNSLAPESCVPLPDGIVSFATFKVDAGALNQQIPLILPDFIDFLAIFPDQQISFLLGDTGDRPKIIRMGGQMILDSANISGLFISNSTASAAHVGVVQARWQAVA